DRHLLRLCLQPADLAGHQARHCTRHHPWGRAGRGVTVDRLRALFVRSPRWPGRLASVQQAARCPAARGDECPDLRQLVDAIPAHAYYRRIWSPANLAVRSGDIDWEASRWSSAGLGLMPLWWLGLRCLL